MLVSLNVVGLTMAGLRTLGYRKSTEAIETLSFRINSHWIRIEPTEFSAFPQVNRPGETPASIPRRANRPFRRRLKRGHGSTPGDE
jgi:hypothetical protein